MIDKTTEEQGHVFGAVGHVASGENVGVGSSACAGRGWP